MKEEETNIQRTSKMQSRMEKGKEQRKLIKEKGITLVALVITIVILIILATVTIAIVFGEGGLIDRAQEAKELTEQAKTEEEQELLNTEIHLNELLAGTGTTNPPEQTATTVSEAKENGLLYKETTKITDDSGDEVWIPGGFGIASDSATEVDDGVVITDGTNEFVWIPVDEESLAEMYIVSETPVALSGSTGVTTNIYSNLKEPDLVTDYDEDSQYYSILASSTQEMAQDMVDEYTATYNSIVKYKGFYIGRYELTGTVDSPTVQKNQTVLTEQNWYYLKKACSNIVNTEYAQSGMIYGNQWDEVMDWLVETGEKTEDEINVNSSSWGNYSDSTGEAATNSGSMQTSGKNEAWKANNIYDLAGNAYDWTQEARSTGYRIVRGGGYGVSGSGTPASDRNNGNPGGSSSKYSSRPALYLK